MENVVCFKHPEYSGQSAPVLSCRVCCAKYIFVIKNKNEARRQDQAFPLAKAVNDGLVHSIRSGASIDPSGI